MSKSYFKSTNLNASSLFSDLSQFVAKPKAFVIAVREQFGGEEVSRCYVSFYEYRRGWGWVGCTGGKFEAKIATYIVTINFREGLKVKNTL